MTELNLFSGLTDGSVEQTMSSREIAELTNKRHDNVLRDIDALNESYGKLHLLKIEESFITRELPNGGSKTERTFKKSKREIPFL